MMCAPFLTLLAAHLAHPFDSLNGVLTRLTAGMECILHRLQAIVPQMRCQRCAILLLLHGSSQSHRTTNLSSGVDVSGVFTKCEDQYQKKKPIRLQAAEDAFPPSTIPEAASGDALNPSQAERDVYVAQLRKHALTTANLMETHAYRAQAQVRCWVPAAVIMLMADFSAPQRKGFIRVLTPAMHVVSNAAECQARICERPIATSARAKSRSDFGMRVMCRV